MNQLNSILEIDEDDDCVTCFSLFKKIYYNICYKIRMFYKNNRKKKENKHNEYLNEYLCR